MTGLVAEDVIVRFGGLIALNGVGLEAPYGRITGLIGPNGAGKTTMFNVCCGFQKADEGTVTLDGKDISGESPARRARLGLGRTFQRMELFGSLTVRENVELARALGRDPRLLLLDEPSSGLDVSESHAFGELLTRLVAERGMGILMIEHDMDLVLGISDWIFVMDFGKPLMNGTADDVRTSEQVRDAYLGKAAA